MRECPNCRGEGDTVEEYIDGWARRIPCGTCGGTGSVDSGGVTPWGAWIEIACPACEGKGFEMGTGREKRRSEGAFDLALSEMRALDKMLWCDPGKFPLEDVRERMEAVEKHLDASLALLEDETREIEERREANVRAHAEGLGLIGQEAGPLGFDTSKLNKSPDLAAIAEHVTNPNADVAKCIRCAGPLDDSGIYCNVCRDAVDTEQAARRALDADASAAAHRLTEKHETKKRKRGDEVARRLRGG
jgi:hypothetical protein